MTKSAIGMVRRPPGPRATTEPPRAMTTEAQSPCGSAWQSEPTSVPRLRTMGSAISGAAAAIVGWAVLEQGRALEIGVPAQRADAQGAVGIGPVVVQARHVVDVDDQVRRGEPELHQRDQALAAGQHLRVVTAVVQQADRLVQRPAVPRSGTGTGTWVLRVSRGVSAGREGRIRCAGVPARRAPPRQSPVPPQSLPPAVPGPPVAVSAPAAPGPAAPAGRPAGPREDSGSGTATGPESYSGSGRGSWCGGHGPATGWPAILR